MHLNEFVADLLNSARQYQKEWQRDQESQGTQKFPNEMPAEDWWEDFLMWWRQQ